MKHATLLRNLSSMEAEIIANKPAAPDGSRGLAWFNLMTSYIKAIGEPALV